MGKAKINFSDGTSLTIDRDTDIFGIRTQENTLSYGEKKLSEQMHMFFPKTINPTGLLPIDGDNDHGLLVPLVDIFQNYNYFYLLENEKKIYSTSAVVSFELVD